VGLRNEKNRENGLLYCFRSRDTFYRADSKPEFFTSVPRSRLAFEDLRNFPRSEIDTLIPLTRKNPQIFKLLSNLTQQLMKYSG
jgi:hypothetical protein